jgi:hypothetical protein
MIKRKLPWRSDPFIIGTCACSGEDIPEIRNSETGMFQQFHKKRGIEPHICGACGDMPVDNVLHVHGFDITTWRAVSKRGEIDSEWHKDKGELI